MKDEKILQDELMTNEELDEVAGGACYETANDSRFLNVLLKGTKYHQCDRYGEMTIFFMNGPLDDVKKAWKSLGITLDGAPLAGNTYILDGKKISQSEAWAHAEKTVGKHLTKEQWNW